MANQYSSLMPATPEELHERRVFVMQKRVECYTFDEIARMVREKFDRPISAVQCAEDYRVVMKARIKELNEPTDTVRAAAIARLHQMMNAIMERVQQGSLDHIEVFLKLEARLAKLTGVDAPTQSELTVKKDGEVLTREQLLEKVALLRERLKSAGSLDSSLPPQNTEVKALNPAPEVTSEVSRPVLEGEVVMADSNVVPFTKP